MLKDYQDSITGYTGMASVILDDILRPVTVPSGFKTEFINKISSDDQKDEIVRNLRKCADEVITKRRLRNFESGNGLVFFIVPFIAEKYASGVLIGAFISEEIKNRSVMDSFSAIFEDPGKLVFPSVSIFKYTVFLNSMSDILTKMAVSRYRALKSEMDSFINAGKLEHKADKLKKTVDLRSDFLANMSHEIRTPMNAILGMAEMAMREEVTPSVRQYLHQIKSSGSALLGIINDVLDFSKIDSGKMDIIESEYEPLSIFYDTAGIISTRIGSKNIELVLDIAPDFPCKLMGDAQRIRQVLINLAGNAAKFTNKGQVLISLDHEENGPDDIFMKVSVRDTGIGIKKEDLNKIFESFQQVDSKRNRNVEGTGLGLAICKRLIALMKGTLTVESEYGKGSVFSFKLPQKVVDHSPSLSVHEPDRVIAAGFFGNRYIAKQFFKDTSRLGVFSCALPDIADFEDMLDNYADRIASGQLYLFYDTARRSPLLDRIIADNPEISFIELTDFGSSERSKKKNLRLLKKPVSSALISMALNKEELHNNISDEAFEFDFIAPDAQVLIVDDNEVNLNIAEGLLEPLKMKITRASGGKEALDLINNNMYDLIFMDHMMPEIDGVETTRVIRRMYKNYDEIPIIALTANVVEGTREMFLSEGMNDYVPKPIEVQTLVYMVKKWLPVEKIQNAFKVEEMIVTDDDLDLSDLGDLDGPAAVKLLGSVSLYRKVLDDYLKSIPSRSSAIQKALKSSDWPAYTVEVHTLKSLSRQIGAMELGIMAAELEKAGNDRNTSFIREYTDPMLAKYQQYEELLRKVLHPELSGNDNEAHKDKPSADASVLNKLFESMTEALGDLDIDMMESVLNELDKYSYDEAQDKLLDQLRTEVANIDIDKCDSILDEWKSLIQGGV
ncbi:MAG: response regulator [Lachnospiraceae bacterium]|nr:response regulator [Lachnospiraceae bacterium]